MAEEFQAGICGGTWWNLSSRSVFGGGCSSPCSAALNDMAGGYGGWPATRGSEETNSVSDSSNVVFHDGDQNKPESGGVLMDSTLQMMGFGVSSSPPTDWNQPFLCSSGRGDSNYSSILQEDMNSNKLNYGQETALDSSQIQKVFSPESQDSTLINPFNPGNIVTSSGNCTPTSSSSYGYSSSLLQNLLGSDHMNQPQPQPQQSLSNANYGANSSEFSPLSSSWSPKISPFFKHSLPKLHFSNNTAFWNASAAAPSLPSFLPQSQSHVLEDKSINATKRNVEEIRDVKKINGSMEAAGLPFKRPRIETPSPLPTFKVRKEKLGDRITALQQLVSPFGKTDTASVLHEAIEYIKFLHEQVNVLSTPYLKNGAPALQHQPGSEQAVSSSSGEDQQDLKSRGLCLVPISSTFPVANETTADFWTPAFGGTFRSIN